jgi:FKBP-type peptidyl-prolyl cis-trans isomerase
MDEERTVYALGVSLAHQAQGEVRQYHLSETETEILLDGFRDGLAGREASFLDEDYGSRLDALARDRGRAAIDAERAAGMAFLDAEAAAPGAVRHESGWVKRVLRAGDGPVPTPDDRVTVDVHGFRRDGGEIRVEGEGRTVRFRVGDVPPCWRDALLTMRAGERSRIACPAELAYGDRGFPEGGVPPGAAVAFEIELVQIGEPPQAAGRGGSIR